MAVSVDKIYEFGEWRLEPAEHLLSRSGSPCPWVRRFSIRSSCWSGSLRLPGHKDEFMKRVWTDSFVGDLALTQNISQLRKVWGTVTSRL